SDNAYSPDAISLSTDGVYFWKNGTSSNARFVTPNGVQIQTMRAFDAKDVTRRLPRLQDVIETLRRDFGSSLPLNFHFVEDTEGHWHFLNIRKGFRPNSERSIDGRQHIVATERDLKNWDRDTPIRLRFRSPRGLERRVIEIAKRLRPFVDR